MSPSASRHETTTLIERLIVVGVFAGLLFGAFQILRPFATAILFASALAIATWPLRDWLVRHGVPAPLAATLLLLIMLAVIGIPAVLLAPALGERLVKGADYVRAYFAEAPELPDWLAHSPWLKDRIDQVWSALTRAEGDLYEIIKPYSTELRNLLIKVGQEFAEAVLQFFLSIAIATMFWVRGEALAATLKEISERLAGPVAARALTAAASSVRGIAYGVVGTAVLQALALTLGLWAAGVPGASLLGFLALLIAMSQIGVLLIPLWAGPAWWLFSTGHPGWGTFMIIWGLLVSTLDNAVRPWLVSFGAAMPIALVFLGVLGGFIAFGFLGIFIGPTLLGVLYTLLQEWRRTPASEGQAP
jgi:predicted PurR-regulated permease PerM